MSAEKPCEVWLREIFQDGESRLCNEIRATAKKAGYTRAELKEARKRLGIKTFHQFDDGGATENWFWYSGGAEHERART